MSNDYKELADAMERGWEMVPHNCYWFFNDTHGVSNIPVEEVKSACAMGHALLGIGSTNVINLYNLFPVLKTRASHPKFEGIETLETIFNTMIDKGDWSTLDAIAWLRSL